MPRLAWYVAQSADRLLAAEKLFGKTLDYRAVINGDSRDGFKSTSSWLFAPGCYLAPLRAAGQPYRKIWWSAPGFWQGGNLADAADGKYNSDYEALARDILKVEGGGSDPIEFRPWFEMNGAWFYWNWVGKEEQGAQAWRQMFTAMMNVSDRFHFEFAPSETSQAQGSFANVEKSWPGDAYVHKCGLDLYWKAFETWQWGQDPDKAFQAALTSRYGLNWLESFAKQHGNKPMVLSEVGVQGGITTGAETVNAEPYIRKLAEWCRARGVSVLWWNGTSSEGFLGDVVSHGNWPKIRAAIKAHFVDPAENGKGQGDGASGTTPAPSQPSDTATPAPSEPEAPAAPQDPAIALLTEINGAAFLARGRYPEPANTAIRTIEDRTYWPLVAASVKNGTVEAGRETDPAKALALVLQAAGSMDGWPAEAAAAVQGWLDRAKALLPATEEPAEPEPEQPAEPEPEPQPETPEDDAAMAELQERIAELTQQLTAEKAARLAAEQRLAAVKAALS